MSVGKLMYLCIWTWDIERGPTCSRGLDLDIPKAVISGGKYQIIGDFSLRKEIVLKKQYSAVI